MTCRRPVDLLSAEIVLGANTGIGKETAKDISKRGARVIILCRNLDKAKAAAEEISKETGGTVDVEKLDLSSLKSVRECAQKLLEKVSSTTWSLSDLPSKTPTAVAGGEDRHSR